MNRRSQRWVYESIVGALPGITISPLQAVAIQIAIFESGIVLLAAVYGLGRGALAGTAAVLVVSAGSYLMHHLGRRIRDLSVPEPYVQLLFGSKIEIVLGLLAYVGLVTYLFAFDPKQPGSDLLTGLVGTDLPLPVVYLTLLVLWDVCYRIGTGWWASIVGLWRTVRYGDGLDPATRRALRRTDALTIGFALVQSALLPFVVGHDLLFVAILGHVVAVTIVSGVSIGLLSR